MPAGLVNLAGPVNPAGLVNLASLANPTVVEELGAPGVRAALGATGPDLTESSEICLPTHITP